jgi:hypothetical protein
MIQRLAVLCLLASLSPVQGGDNPPAQAQAAGKVDYRQDVWPILKRHCWGCHSGSNPEGGLSLDTRGDMLKGGDNGPLFQPGKPDESLLIRYLVGDRPKMPRKQPPLSEAKIQTLRQWVLAGAEVEAFTAEKVVRIPAAYDFAPAVTSVAFHPEGQRLAVGCRSEVVILDPQGKVLSRLPTESGLLSHVEYSPDGKVLAAVGGTPGRYGEVRFFDGATGKLVSSRRIGRDTLFRGSFDPAGKAVAVGGADGAVHVIPVDAGAPAGRFDLHSDWVMDVAYTPDGTMLVSGGRDKTTKVTSVETGKLLRLVDTSTEPIRSVGADAADAISAGAPQSLIAFDFKIALSGVEVTGAGNGAQPVNKRNQYAKNFEGQPGEVLDLALSADRKRLAVAGNFAEVRIYEVNSRKRITQLAKLPAPIYGAALNRDGSLLLVGSKSGRVQLYDVAGAKLLFDVVPVPVTSARANP